MTPLQKRAALDLASKGWSIEDIATAFEISLSSVDVSTPQPLPSTPPVPKIRNYRYGF